MLFVKKLHVAKTVNSDEASAQAVVDVVIVVGDLVSDVGDLRFKSRLVLVQKTLAEIAKLFGVVCRAMF